MFISACINTFHRSYRFYGKCREVYTQPAIKCSKLKIETLEQGVKYAQS